MSHSARRLSLLQTRCHCLGCNDILEADMQAKRELELRERMVRAPASKVYLARTVAEALMTRIPATRASRLACEGSIQNAFCSKCSKAPLVLVSPRTTMAAKRHGKSLAMPCCSQFLHQMTSDFALLGRDRFLDGIFLMARMSPNKVFGARLFNLPGDRKTKHNFHCIKSQSFGCVPQAVLSRLALDRKACASC